MELDLASLGSARRFCAAFNARGLPLHHLVCNAAAICASPRAVTGDGNELHLQVRGRLRLPALAGRCPWMQSRAQGTSAKSASALPCKASSRT
jgi:hypothetical protein